MYPPNLNILMFKISLAYKIINDCASLIITVNYLVSITSWRWPSMTLAWLGNSAAATLLH